MKSKQWRSVILCGLAMILIIGLSAGVIGLSFAGAAIVPAAPVIVREETGSLSADFSAYGFGKEELDPTILFERAQRQTVCITWEGLNEDGEPKSVSASGIIVSTDGYILTNAHCVSNAFAAGDTMLVEFYDGTTYTGQIIGCDTETDVALMKIEATGLWAATFSTAKIKGGQKVYAMGNPDEVLKFTMTSGIISGLNRTIDFDDGNTLKMFQFDAPVNPGNSGGPLYDVYGAVIGVVTAKFMSLTTEGISLAIPIQDAVRIAGELKEFGYVTGRPLMGVTVVAIGENKLGPGSPAGVMVHSTEEGLAGARAGLIKGDIIVSINGEAVASLDDLTRVKRNYKAGDTVRLRYWRAGQFMETYLTFDEVTPAHPTGPVEVEDADQYKDKGEWDSPLFEQEPEEEEPGEEGSEEEEPGEEEPGEEDAGEEGTEEEGSDGEPGSEAEPEEDNI
jgi:serine protease Do